MWSGVTETHLGDCRTSMTEFFEKIINDQEPVITNAKTNPALTLEKNYK